MATDVRTKLPYAWGATPDEIAASYPGDNLAGDGWVRAIRAVDSAGSPEALFAWMCQTRRGPYSYDLIDNLGRRSPRDFDPTMLELEVGQEFMTIFSLVDFEPGHSITLQIKPGRARRLFGPVICTYVSEPGPRGGSRLVCAIYIPPVGRVLPKLRRTLLTWGDVVMMRKQLRTLADLAGRTPPGQAP